MQKSFLKNIKLKTTLSLLLATHLVVLPVHPVPGGKVSKSPSSNNPHSMPPGLAKKLLENGSVSQGQFNRSVNQFNRVITTVSPGTIGANRPKNTKTQNEDSLLKGSLNAKKNSKLNGSNTGLVSFKANKEGAQTASEPVKMHFSKVGERVSFKPAMSAALEEDFLQLADKNKQSQGALKPSVTNFRLRASNFQNWLNECFSADTPITLADGSQKRIAGIEVGDSVLSFDQTTKSYAPKKVLKIFHKVAKDLRQLEITNGLKLEVTPDHPFWREGQWVAAVNLRPGDKLLNRFGEPVLLKANLPLAGPKTVYNFEVEDNHTYLAQGVLVHNLCVIRDGNLAFVASDIELMKADLPLPNIGELEFPVVDYLKSNPQQGHLVGEHPEIASNIVAGVIGLSQENLKITEDKVSRGEVTPKFAKNLIFELIMLTFNFGPTATTEFVQYAQSNDREPLANPEMLKYVQKNPVLWQWLQLNKGSKNLKT